MRIPVVLCGIAILIGVAVAVLPSTTPSTLLRLDDLNQSVEKLLRDLPGVGEPIA